MAKRVLKVALVDDKSILERFDFIGDKFILENIKIYTRYIVFLYSLSKEYEMFPDIYYSIYKDVIIYSAQIVEALCEYTVSIFMHDKSLKERMMGKEWVRIQSKEMDLPTELFPTDSTLDSSNYRITNKVERKQVKKYEPKQGFSIVIGCCKNSRMFTKEFIDKVLALQSKRNNIHIGNMEFIDDAYKEADVKKVFSDVSFIVDEIKKLFDEPF